MFERYSERARRLIFMAHWSASRRGGWYIEPEDLLHALIREDRGEFPAVSAELFPGTPIPIDETASGNQAFFTDEAAKNLLRALHEDADFLKADMGDEKREPAPHVDLPLSDSLKRVMAWVAKAHQNDTRTIEPLDLLAAILQDRESKLAELLRGHGISRQKVARAIASESSG